MIRAIIFDFDGTLTELTLNFLDMKAQVFDIARKYAKEEVIAEVEALYVLETVYELEKHIGDNKEIFVEEALEKVKVLELEASEGKGVFPYTRALLRDVRDKGIKIGVITRSCTDVLKSVFPDIENYVDGIVTREHTRQVKPDPEQVKIILRRLNVPAHEALFVGDHPTDVIAGKAAGTYTAGVLSGRTTKDAFEKVSPDYIFNDIRNVRELR